jgi:hypothetical protein
MAMTGWTEAPAATLPLDGGAGSFVDCLHSGRSVGARRRRGPSRTFLSGTDRVDQSGIDANGAGAGNTAFDDQHIGLLRWAAALHSVDGTDTVLEGDVDGDSVTDTRIQLTDIHTFVPADGAPDALHREAPDESRPACIAGRAPSCRHRPSSNHGGPSKKSPTSEITAALADFKGAFHAASSSSSST